MSLAMQITRRARLAGLMGEGIAVLPTSLELARNADTQDRKSTRLNSSH